MKEKTPVFSECVSVFPDSAALVVLTEDFVSLHCVEHNMELECYFPSASLSLSGETVSTCDAGSVFEDYCATEAQKILMNAEQLWVLQS